MLKIDQFNNIQLGTVYRGRKRLSDAEVKKLYGRLRLPWSYVEGVRFYSNYRDTGSLVDFMLPKFTCHSPIHYKRNLMRRKLQNMRKLHTGNLYF